MNRYIQSRIVRARALPVSLARGVAMLALTVLFAGACSDSTGPEGLATLTVTPPTQTVQVTQTVNLSATGTSAPASR
jgi:hypothetical protein